MVKLVPMKVVVDLFHEFCDEPDEEMMDFLQKQTMYDVRFVSGRYANEAVTDVFKKDLDYIKWCASSTSFKFHYPEQAELAEYLMNKNV